MDRIREKEVGGYEMNGWNEKSTVDMNKKPKQHEKGEILVKCWEVL